MSLFDHNSNPLFARKVIAQREKERKRERKIEKDDDDIQASRKKRGRKQVSSKEERENIVSERRGRKKQKEKPQEENGAIEIDSDENESVMRRRRETRGKRGRRTKIGGQPPIPTGRCLRSQAGPTKTCTIETKCVLEEKEKETTSSLPKNLLQMIDEAEEVVLQDESEPKHQTIKKRVRRERIRSQSSDCDLSLLSVIQIDEMLEITLVVCPELLNPATNAARPLKERKNPMEFQRKMKEDQKFCTLVQDFLKSDKSTWDIDELRLKSYSVEIPMDSTPSEADIVDKDQIKLCLKEITPSSPKKGGKEEEFISLEIEEESVTIVVQSKKYGADCFRLPFSKTIGMLRGAFGAKHNLSQREIDKVTFQFDGEALSLNQTPRDLDLEDEDVIDAILK